MKTTTHLTLLIILSSALSTCTPLQAASGAFRAAHAVKKIISPRVMHLASKLKHIPSKKFVLKVGTAAVIAYIVRKMAISGYQKYSSWKKARNQELMSRTLKEIALKAKLDHQARNDARSEPKPKTPPWWALLPTPQTTPKVAPTNYVDAKAAAEKRESDAKAEGDRKVANAATAASGETEAKKLEDERWFAAQARADQKKEVERKAAEADLAPFTSYSNIPQPVPTVIQAPSLRAMLQQPQQQEHKIDADAIAASDALSAIINHIEEKHTAEQKIGAAEHMQIPIEEAQKTVFDMYNRGREYIRLIYSGQAALIPQENLEQYTESLRSIMWFLYMVSEEKVHCSFDEGTICIHDPQNKLYDFLRAKGFAQPRISTHFKEFESKSDGNADSKRRAEEQKIDYGIDVIGLPTGKQHILFGKLKEEYSYIKLENYGLGITGIIPHGWEAFVAYIRKIKMIREKTYMVSDDHETFRKERVPEDIISTALEHLTTIKELAPQEVTSLAKKFKDFGIQVIVPFFRDHTEGYPVIQTWVAIIMAQYPDWRNRKGREVILSHEEIVSAPVKNSEMYVIVIDEQD